MEIRYLKKEPFNQIEKQILHFPTALVRVNQIKTTTTTTTTTAATTTIFQQHMKTACSLQAAWALATQAAWSEQVCVRQALIILYHHFVFVLCFSPYLVCLEGLNHFFNGGGRAHGQPDSPSTGSPFLWVRKTIPPASDLMGGVGWCGVGFVWNFCSCVCKYWLENSTLEKDKCGSGWVEDCLELRCLICRLLDNLKIGNKKMCMEDFPHPTPPQPSAEIEP